jgi:hypothetical protein
MGVRILKWQKPCRLTNVQYLLRPVQATGFETVKPALVRTVHLSARTYAIVKKLARAL